MSITCVKERSKLIFTRSDKRTATYDLADASCYNFQGRKVKSLNSFFANYGMYSITWEDVNYEKFVNVVNNNTRFTNVGSMLTALHQYRHAEGYILLGLPVTGKYSKPISDYPKLVRKYLIGRFANVENAGYRRNSNSYTFRQWLTYFEDESTDKLRFIQLIDQLDMTEIFGELDTYSLNTLFNMSRDHNMDLKSLLLKIREYIQREGLTLGETTRNLSDYNRMSKTMSTKYQKYPKYLLSTHSIVVRNYNSFKETYEEQAFLNMVDKSLAHKGVTYSILVAEKSQDIKDEGANQHHCVASYVKQIINGTTQIVFMRLNNNIDKPLLTIEVNNGKVQQAKGSYNRGTSEDELKFIHTYAKAHDLGVSNYL
jgi:hypothetical protein